MKKLLAFIVLCSAVYAQAQVKIGNNPSTIDANSLLELESTNKGFLAPRVTLTSLTSVSPLTGTVPAGMLVYNSAGSLTFGYYYWDGSEWKKLDNGEMNLVTKTANATLTKTENFVIASNDITLTLPAVTAANNGMEIAIKNMGTHTDLITIVGNGGATIDGITDTKLTRFASETFVVSGTNWLVKEAPKHIDYHIMDIDEYSSWATIQEAIEFLEIHMTGPTVIRLVDDDYSLSETIVIDLPYPLTIQGLSYGVANISAESGLTNKPMFRCLSECFFKMLTFDATSLASYGTLAGEDAIRFLGSGTYNEIKDCTFDGFYNTILDSTDAEIWVFETDITNSHGSGILVHSVSAGAIVKVAETDFIGCNYGINLSKGSGTTIQLASGGYYNGAAGDTAIFYQPTTFTFTSISITGNTWNNTGKYIEGFDFTRTDGRDANVILESNAGMGDKRPICYINLLNSATTTTLTTANSWYKVNWDYTKVSSSTVKWTITNASGGVANVNRITFQPTNKRDGVIIITGNLSVNQTNRTISLGLVKNGSSGTRYGETTLRTAATSNTASQFSTVIYLSDIAATDYFEVFCSSANSGDIITMLDLNWQVITQ